MELQVSLAARQLINALLNRDPASRLGSNSGASEIKEHPFFRVINWPLIRCMVLVILLFSVLKNIWANLTIIYSFEYFRFIYAEPATIRCTSSVNWERRECQRYTVGRWRGACSFYWVILEVWIHFYSLGSSLYLLVTYMTSSSIFSIFLSIFF